MKRLRELNSYKAVKKHTLSQGLLNHRFSDTESATGLDRKVCYNLSKI